MWYGTIQRFYFLANFLFENTLKKSRVQYCVFKIILIETSVMPYSKLKKVLPLLPSYLKKSYVLIWFLIVHDYLCQILKS
jgi:hypothetical protein